MKAGVAGESALLEALEFGEVGAVEGKEVEMVPPVVGKDVFKALAGGVVQGARDLG